MQSELAIMTETMYLVKVFIDQNLHGDCVEWVVIIGVIRLTFRNSIVTWQFKFYCMTF